MEDMLTSRPHGRPHDQPQLPTSRTPHSKPHVSLSPVDGMQPIEQHTSSARAPTTPVLSADYLLISLAQATGARL
jgi:hypothetical protein